MKRRLDKYRKRIICFCLTCVIYRILYVLSIGYFSGLYLFEWTSRNYYLYTGIIALFLVLLNKPLISFSITLGNLVGIVMGQFVGDWIREINIAKIMPDTTAEQNYRLHHHPGVEIWLCTMIIFVIVSIIMIKYKKLKENR